MQTQRTKSCRTNHDIEATAAQSRTHPFIQQRFRYKSLIILTEPGHVTSPPAPHPQTSPASQTSSATNPPSTVLEPQITLAPSAPRPSSRAPTKLPPHGHSETTTWRAQRIPLWMARGPPTPVSPARTTRKRRADWAQRCEQQ
jgi:hypothetical protein